MIKRAYKFENGYVSPMNRGASLWNGSEGDIGPGNPRRLFNDLVYEAIGAESVWSDGYYLKGIKVTIEIEEATSQ
jgi:hypothetical protein